MVQKHWWFNEWMAAGLSARVAIAALTFSGGLDPEPTTALLLMPTVGAHLAVRF